MSFWVLEEPAFVVGRVPNEDTLGCVRLELFPLVFLHMHIAGAAKNSKMRHIRL